MQKRLFLLILPLVFFASACSSANIEQTLAAQNAILGTQMADLRITATVEADHLIVTLENAYAQMTNVQFQNTLLEGTLIARNADPTALAMFTPQAGLILGSQPTQAPNTAAQAGATIFVPTPQAGRETPTPEPALAPQVTETPVPPSGATLYNLVMSSGVRGDDCALDPVSQFTTANTEIYIVARTQGIQAGMTLLSRWYREGTQQISHSFAPQNDIPDDRCVWFFIDQTEVTFTPGNWSVQLEVDGVPVGTAQFTISA
jgi:hypothetical protein